MRWIYSGKRLMLLTCKSKFFVFGCQGRQLKQVYCMCEKVFIMQRHARKGTVPLVFSAIFQFFNADKLVILFSLKQFLASFLLVDNRVKVIVTQLVVISNRALSLPPSIRDDMIERLGSTYNENRDRIVPFFTS